MKLVPIRWRVSISIQYLPVHQVPERRQRRELQLTALPRRHDALKRSLLASEVTGCDRDEHARICANPGFSCLTGPVPLVAVEVVMANLYSEVMTSTAHKQPVWLVLLRRLLAWLSQDWLIALLELAQQFGAYLLHQNQDLYENLNYEATLELLSATGKTAIFRKEQRVRFLQNHIIAFEDYAWGAP
jgi:hypothetical protein